MEIKYTTKTKAKGDIYSLYECLGWNDFLKLKEEQLEKAMEQSFRVIYAYDGENLVGTGRIISDGVTNAYLCGLGVIPTYRGRGIGTEIMRGLADYCKDRNLHLQFFCEEGLVPYYRNMGFKTFAVGMKLE